MEEQWDQTRPYNGWAFTYSETAIRAMVATRGAVLIRLYRVFVQKLAS